jgi:hypothetical protein
MVLALMAAGTFLLSAWPRRWLGLNSDGALLLALLKAGPPAGRLTAVFAMSGASASGERPRERNPVWLGRAIACADGSYEEASAYFFVYFQTLDAGEPERAAAYLDRVLCLWQTLPPLVRSHYFLEAAYFEGRYGRDADAARAWLDLAQGGLLVERHTRLRAEAAVLLAEGHREAARARAEEGLAAIGRTYDQGSAKAEADWLRELMAITQNPPPGEKSTPPPSGGN